MYHEKVLPNGFCKETIDSLVDYEDGTLDRRIFSDEELYKVELERIFARAWNFMAHDSMIPNPGDYFVTYIGEDQIIVSRDEEGQVHAMLNSCRHRGNALCRAEQGNAESFVCAYHGWNFALNGDLIGVPGMTPYYKKDFDKKAWGLRKVAQLDCYKGFWFANLDPEAPPLLEYLGPVGRGSLDFITAQGEVRVSDGIQKNIIDTNWKIAVDNLFDWYHVQYSHGAAISVGMADKNLINPQTQGVILGEYGHGVGGPMVPSDVQADLDTKSQEERTEYRYTNALLGDLKPVSMREEIGEALYRSNGHPNIFPNLWIAISGSQICLRLPRGPKETELWWFTIIPEESTEEEAAFLNGAMGKAFGPSGLLEQDDGENWSQSSRRSYGSQSSTLQHNLKMGLGQYEVKVDDKGVSYVEGAISEHGQRWTYNAWKDWMTAEDWQDLKANHTMPPKEGRI